MKSGWMVRPACIAGEGAGYTVTRLRDATKVDEPCNQENYGSYKTRAEALAKAKELNARAAEEFWKGERK